MLHKKLRECIVCQREFTTLRGHHIYCSKVCQNWGKARSLNRKCLTCNKIIVNLNESGYCYDCLQPIRGLHRKGDKNWNWKGGISTHYISKITKEVLNKHNRSLTKCENCGKVSKISRHKGLLVHHKNQNRVDHRTTNLKVLCRSCHGKEHKNQRILKKILMWLRTKITIEKEESKK